MWFPQEITELIHHFNQTEIHLDISSQIYKIFKVIVSVLFNQLASIKPSKSLKLNYSHPVSLLISLESLDLLIVKLLSQREVGLKL